MRIFTMHVCWLYNLLYLPFSLGTLMEDPWGSPSGPASVCFAILLKYHLILLSHLLQVLIRLLLYLIKNLSQANTDKIRNLSHFWNTGKAASPLGVPLPWPWGSGWDIPRLRCHGKADGI